MTVKSALDGVEAILGIIAKGDADPSVKLVAIRKLAETLRNDIQDLADVDYANYIAADEGDEKPFDMAGAVETLHERLAKQDYNNLYAYYDIDGIRFADERPPVRVAIAKALLQIAVELKRDANPAWEGVVSIEGFIGDDE
jgi:hypothetical protein